MRPIMIGVWIMIVAVLSALATVPLGLVRRLVWFSSLAC